MFSKTEIYCASAECVSSDLRAALNFFLKMSDSRAKKSKVNAPRVAATRSQRNSSGSTAEPATSAAESAQTSTFAAAPAAMNEGTIATIVSQATGKAAKIVLEQLRSERATSTKRARADRGYEESEFGDNDSEFSDGEDETRGLSNSRQDRSTIRQPIARFQNSDDEEEPIRDSGLRELDARIRQLEAQKNASTSNEGERGEVMLMFLSRSKTYYAEKKQQQETTPFASWACKQAAASARALEANFRRIQGGIDRTRDRLSDLRSLLAARQG